MADVDALAPALEDLRLWVLHRLISAVRHHIDGDGEPLELPEGPISHLEALSYTVAAAEVISEVCQEAGRRGLAERLPAADGPTDVALVGALEQRMRTLVDDPEASDADTRRGCVLMWGGTRLLLALADDLPGEDELPSTTHFEDECAAAGELLRPVLAHLPATVAAATRQALTDEVAPILAELTTTLSDDAHRVDPDAGRRARAILHPALVREARGEARPVLAMMAGVSATTIERWIPPLAVTGPWEPTLRENAFGTEVVE